MTHEGFHQDTVELEQQYNLRLRHPNYESEILPRWNQRSHKFRMTGNGHLDIAYGLGERDRFDIFLTADSATKPLLIFIHGGYWQRGDKSSYSFLAQAFVDNNVSVALVNYDLCPSIHIRSIPEQIQRAVLWIYHSAIRLNVSPENIFLMGHSAGAHLAAMAMSVDWSSLDPTLPSNILKGSILLSGLYDLTSIVNTTINDKLGMNFTEAQSQSPINVFPLICHRHLIISGDLEPLEFHRQSDTYQQALSRVGQSTQRVIVSNADHFSELDLLANQTSLFFHATLDWLKTK